jgi:hypothetical protein
MQRLIDDLRVYSASAAAAASFKPITRSGATAAIGTCG